MCGNFQLNGVQSCENWLFIPYKIRARQWCFWCILINICVENWTAFAVYMLKRTQFLNVSIKSDQKFIITTINYMMSKNEVHMKNISGRQENVERAHCSRKMCEKAMKAAAVAASWEHMKDNFIAICFTFHEFNM